MGMAVAVPVATAFNLHACHEQAGSFHEESSRAGGVAGEQTTEDMGRVAEFGALGNL